MVFCPRDLDAAARPAAPAVEWEDTACPLCDGGRRTLLVEAPDLAPGGSGLWFPVVRCKDCGLCFTSPRPGRAAISRFYPPLYEPHRPAAGRRAGRRWRLPLLGGDPRRDRRALPLHGQGRLLDFGCGGGGFLERMRRQGWQVTGVDVSAATVRRVQSELGLRVLAGTLPHPELPEGAFDVVTMWHSLEHVHEPLRVLRAAHRLLAHGGKLIVAVPNIDSAAFAWFGRWWAGLDLPRHLTHFGPRTLLRMLQRAGFEPGPARMVRHSSWLRASAKRACEGSAGSLWSRWLCAKPPSRLATWYSYLTRQSDCITVTAVKRSG